MGRRRKYESSVKAAREASTPSERFDQVFSGGTAAINSALASFSNKMAEIADNATTTILPSIAGAAAAAASQLTYTGIVGDFTSAEEVVMLQGKFIPIVGQDPEDFGSPLMQRVRLDTLSGFILCEHPHIEYAPGATVTEIETIESYLVGGFFYE